MFERLNTPEEAYAYKLGATLKMEEKVLEILDESIEHAHEEKVKALLREHRAESENHVKNVEEVFGLFGWDADEKPCPAIEGLEKEAKANVKKTDEHLVDGIILQGCVEVEHHEIGVYENLIINATAMGRDDVVQRLERNVESERSALEKVKALQAELAAKVKQPA
ncbi:MAG: YciE/YciF ferroxidase family protein [Solirubrobacterales bacterium]